MTALHRLPNTTQAISGVYVVIDNRHYYGGKVP